MPILRSALVSSLGLFLLTGCAPMTSGDPAVVLLPDAKPGAGADVTFAYLKMEQAMRHDDMPALLDAARTLLERQPSSRPLADATGWLLGNRYTEEARALLKASVAALPDDLQLHIMLAETMLDEGDAEAAIQQLKNFAAAHPENASARVELALLYLKADQPSEALRQFQRLPAAERNPSVRYYHAQALKATGNLSAAASMLRSALAEAPDFMEAMLELALVEEQQKNYSEARRLYEKLLAYDEGNQDILLRLVVVSLKEGNPDKAYKIASSVPDSLSFALTATTLFMDEGRYDLADTLLALLAKNPDTPEEIAVYQAAVAYEGEKNIDKALKFLSEITPGNRHYAKALKLRIQILYENGNFDDALEAIAEGVQAFPDDKEFRYVLMELLMFRQRYAEAQAAAEAAMRLWPDDADLAFQHAYLLELQGRRGDALALMEGIAERWPDNAPALNYIGYTLADQNRDLARALQLLEKAVELSPETDYILDSLAWAHYRLGHYPEAWKHIRHALSLVPPDQPQDAAMWDHYGDIARAVGDKNEARKGWRKALELKPEDAEAIRRKLEQL